MIHHYSRVARVGGVFHQELLPGFDKDTDELGKDWKRQALVEIDPNSTARN